MPAKHPVKERAWGTRYDTLKSSPSSSSVQTSPVATTASQHSPIPKSSTATASDDEKPEDAEQVPSVAVPKLERPHNDNSIFVGSLPTHIDPTELTYMLTQHFAEYAQVKDVKAVRDVIKGSVCAFLTCENATAASQLLKTLQETPPKPFQGRTLRFEFARASRTLVVSYRVPSHLVYPNSGLDGTEPDAMSLTSHRPSAMRIYRPQNSKHTAVLYDSDALNFEAKATSPLPSPEVMNASTSTDKLSGSGVLIEPLNYDSETLHKIALAFGPIELFGPFIPNRDGGDSELLKSSNSPADAAHSLDMGEGPWEVKWQHRDDCVNASMTLRRIPHLSVNWAHHLNNDGQTESRFASPSGSPGPFHSMPRMRHLSRSVVHPESDYKRLQDHRQHFSPNIISSAGNLRLMTSPYSERALSPNFKHSSPTYSSPRVRAPSSPLVDRDARREFSPDTALTQGINEAEFPPLNSPCRHRNAIRPLSLPWIPRDTCKTDFPTIDRAAGSTFSPSPSSSLSVQPSTPGAARSTPSPAVRDIDRPASQPPSSPAIEVNTDEADQGQELTVPPTPEFTVSSITPVTPKTGGSYPLTPQSARTMDYSAPSSENFHMTPRRAGRFGDSSMSMDEVDASREVDPYSVFIGNLDVNAPQEWTEKRLRDIFGKYGVMEDIKLYDPAHKNVAFAFIKYADAESSARAVAEEHQNMYDGRMIRVQLRELKPFMQRAPFKAMRGRGRARMYGDSLHHMPTSTGGPDFEERARDGLGGGLSPRTMHGRTSYRQDMRHGVSRDLPPHLALRTDTSEAAAPAQYHAGRYGEHKGPCPPEDRRNLSWKPPMPHHTQTQGHSERSAITSSATSASISPPPSSSGSHPSSAFGHAPPYPMVMPWMHPYHAYPYAMPYMAPYVGYPPHMVPSYPQVAPDGTGSDASASHQQAWMAQSYMYKKPAAYPTSTDPAHPQMYTAPNAEVQPPLQAVAFEHTSTGMFVPMYPPDALNQYMSTQGQVHSNAHTPPPQVSATVTHQQQQPPTSTYPPYAPVPQMPLYPYPYAPQMPLAPAASQAAAANSQYQPMASGWPQGAATTGQPGTSQNYSQHTHPSYLPQSVSSAGPTPMTGSASVGGHYAGAGLAQSDQHHGYRGNIPPRRGMNRAHTYNNINKHINTRASPNHFHRQAPNGQMEMSYSFNVDPMPPSRSQYQGPSAMRPYSTPFGASRSVNGV